MIKTMHLAGLELVLMLRRGESLLVAVVIPATILVFFTTIEVTQINPAMSAVDFYLPASATAAIMGTCMVALGISTGFERHYGVLKRLGGTPLTRGNLISAKAFTVFSLVVLQAFFLILIASMVLNWQSGLNVVGLFLSLSLGAVAFSGIGLYMAGTLRAEANLAMSNIVFLVLLVAGGVVVPVSSLPPTLESISSLLPSTALWNWFNWSMNGNILETKSAWVLISWAALAPLVASLRFRWE